jgi:hypothetical protein
VVVLEGEANPQDGARELEQALCLPRRGKNETLRKDCPFQVVCEQQMKKCKSRKSWLRCLTCVRENGLFEKPWANRQSENSPLYYSQKISISCKASFHVCLLPPPLMAADLLGLQHRQRRGKLAPVPSSFKHFPCVPHPGRDVSLVHTCR